MMTLLPSNGSFKLLFTFLLLGCASSPAGERSRSNSGPITAEELADVHTSYVLDAVRILRPTWRRINGAFLDGMAVTPSQLNDEPLQSIGEIDLLTAEEAVAKYGVRAVTANYLDVKRKR